MIDIQKLRRAHERAVQARKDYLAWPVRHHMAATRLLSIPKRSLLLRNVQLPTFRSSSPKPRKQRDCVRRQRSWPIGSMKSTRPLLD